jgi:hypothetical protein
MMIVVGYLEVALQILGRYLVSDTERITTGARGIQGILIGVSAEYLDRATLSQLPQAHQNQNGKRVGFFTGAGARHPGPDRLAGFL